jgi:hypothetical protein
MLAMVEALLSGPEGAEIAHNFEMLIERVVLWNVLWEVYIVCYLHAFELPDVKTDY